MKVGVWTRRLCMAFASFSLAVCLPWSAHSQPLHTTCTAADRLNHSVYFNSDMGMTDDCPPPTAADISAQLNADNAKFREDTPTTSEKADKNQNENNQPDDADKALSECLSQRIQSDESGKFTSYDGGKSAMDLLVKECPQQWQTWVDACVAAGLTLPNCRVNSLLFAQAALRLVYQK